MITVKKAFRIIKNGFLKCRYFTTGNNIVFSVRSVKFGKNVFLSAADNSSIVFNEGAVVTSGCHLEAFSGGRITVGGGVYINRNSMIVAKERITIGNRVTIGPNVMIYDHDHTIGSESGHKYVSKEISIGDNAWVAAGAIILKGVTIGENSVIGAGAVVTHDVPSNTVYYNKVVPCLRPF